MGVRRAEALGLKTKQAGDDGITLPTPVQSPPEPLQDVYISSVLGRVPGKALCQLRNAGLERPGTWLMEVWKGMVQWIENPHTV